ncbi:MAG: nucleoside triphosphate pyrophosphohydrolase family protein [bacterium]
MENLTVNDYQEEALKTVIYPDEGDNLIYPVLGLNGEAGEMAEKLKKIIRDNEGKIEEDKKEELARELGDVFWYLAVCAHELGFELEEIARHNLNKLADREQRNKLQGSGDNR